MVLNIKPSVKGGGGASLCKEWQKTGGRESVKPD